MATKTNVPWPMEGDDLKRHSLDLLMNGLAGGYGLTQLFETQDGMVRCKAVMWNGREVVQVVAEWPEDAQPRYVNEQLTAMQYVAERAVKRGARETMRAALGSKVLDPDFSGAAAYVHAPAG